MIEPTQRAVLLPDEEAASATPVADHAEKICYDYAIRKGYTPVSVVAYPQPICGPCDAYLPSSVQRLPIDLPIPGSANWGF